MRSKTVLPLKISAYFTAFWVVLLWSTGVQACETSLSENAPSREIIACGDALTLEREPSADVLIEPPESEAEPRVIQLRGGAILIDIAPGHAPTEVRTPHAIATVRGTTYIVDAGAEQTSVFVLEGGVDVSSVSDASTVILHAGEGADVSAEAPLTVKIWGTERVDALLARFGR